MNMIPERIIFVSRGITVFMIWFLKVVWGAFIYMSH